VSSGELVFERLVMLSLAGYTPGGEDVKESTGKWRFMRQDFFYYIKEQRRKYQTRQDQSEK
jgi:hypothetical protein